MILRRMGRRKRKRGEEGKNDKYKSRKTETDVIRVRLGICVCAVLDEHVCNVSTTMTASDVKRCLSSSLNSDK